MVKLAHLAFPYYVVSAGVTSMVQTMSSAPRAGDWRSRYFP